MYIYFRSSDGVNKAPPYFINTDSVEHRSRTECIYADYRLHTSTFERGGVGCRLGGVSRRARRLIKIFIIPRPRAQLIRNLGS